MTLCLPQDLDAIFFENIPVGIVTKIEVQSSYTVAHIKTYSDTFHPKTFFLINDAKATLAEGFDSNNTKLLPIHTATNTNAEQNTSSSTIQADTALTSMDANESIQGVSSIPSRIDQTQEEVIEPELPVEVTEEPKKVNTNAVKQSKPKPDSSSLDLF